MVEVHLYGDLRRLAENKAVDGESIAWASWRSGDTVQSVLARIGIDLARDVSNVFINGAYVYRAGGAPIQDTARLGVFPKNMSALYI